MKRELGIARCGLACCLCSENTKCNGCNSGECPDNDWCENKKCSIEQGVSHCYLCQKDCKKGLLSKIKPYAFNLFIKRYGEEYLLDCLEKNELNGVVYHREGINGDYDDFEDVEKLISFIKTGEKATIQGKTAMNIAVFASHGGSDLQAIIDGCKSNRIGANVAVVISNNGNSMALQRANNEDIPSYHLSAKKFGTEELLAEKILEVLSKYQIDMIFLAGYMRMLHISVLQRYNNRIFNIHPALLPKFGGKGMYGMNVHNAVIEAKETETGVTIHRVSAEYDSGEIVAQTKVPVLENDTPEVLAARVLEREHEFLVEVISDIVDGKIVLG